MTFDMEPRDGESGKEFLARLIREGCPPNLWCAIADGDRERATALNQSGSSNAKHLEARPADTEDRHNSARDSRYGRDA